MKLCPKCQKQFSDDANFCPVDAARLIPLDSPDSGADGLAARFDLGSKLGGTRTGAVHRATDKTSGATCAVKLVAPEVLALPGVAQRLEREFKQLERVKSAGVCQVVASGKRSVPGGEGFWIATELLDGAQTLAEAITARGPMSQEQAAELVEQVGEALIEAAQAGVVHRDLAPKNILLAGKAVKLINFSLPVPTSDKVPGVPEFVAPEQVEGRPVDQRSNLYSLGTLYYYVLTGMTPFAGSPSDVHQQLVSGTVTPPSELLALPQPVEAVILRALDRSPTKRFLTVRQLVDEVMRVGHGDVVELTAKASSRSGGDVAHAQMGFSGAEARPASAPAEAPPAQAAPVETPAVAPAAVVPVVAQPAEPAPVADSVGTAATMLGVTPSPVATTPAQAPASDAPRARTDSAGAGTAETPSRSEPSASSPPPVVAAPVVPPPVVAAPVVAPPVVAPPVVAAPVVAGASGAEAPVAAGKRKAASEDRVEKGRFRETLWFKKGELDAEAARKAAEESKRGNELSDKADSAPMDERYIDDGTVTRSDKDRYSVRTGNTQMLRTFKETSSGQPSVSEDVLVGEMKQLPRWIVAGLALGAVGIVAAILSLAL